MSPALRQLDSYPDVEALLRELLDRVRAVLGARFVGAYLFGSLATGDFDDDSDVDVVIVTDNAVPPEVLASLQCLHADLATIESRWATEFEVSYIPRRALRRFDPADCRHPRLERGPGETLAVKRHDSDWVVQRHLIRERGVTLAGPDPRTLIDPVAPGDLRRAMHDLLWWPAELLADPSPIRTRGYQSYLVLTMCRILYTLAHGEVVSKRDAAEWAKRTLDPRWSALINDAWVGRSAPDGPATTDEVKAPLDFIRHTLDRHVAWASRPSNNG
jgi:predicted nucleotidyltransferase